MFNAEVSERTSVANPAKVMKSAEGQWLAFSIPARADTHSPCCWTGKWNGMGEVGCSLEARHQSYGARSDSPLADKLIVFGQIREGEVHKLRVVGESCPVDANGAQVTWIGDVSVAGGLDWLESAARSDSRKSAGGSALFAMALHRDPGAGNSVELFHEALESSAQERSELLESRCADDPELRARIEALLRSHDSAPQFLDPLKVDRAATDDPMIGSTIGRAKARDKRTVTVVD